MGSRFCDIGGQACGHTRAGADAPVRIKLVDLRCAVCAAANDAAPGRRVPHEEIERLTDSAAPQPFATHLSMRKLSLCKRGALMSLLAHRHAACNERPIKLGVALT